MSKEQMRIVCHISKRTALYLLQFGLIPNETTGKKTRCCKIKKSDVVALIEDREVNPSKYIAPENWYKYGGENVNAFKIRLMPELPDESRLREYYEQKFSRFQDVMGFDIVQDRLRCDGAVFFLEELREGAGGEGRSYIGNHIGNGTVQLHERRKRERINEGGIYCLLHLIKATIKTAQQTLT